MLTEPRTTDRVAEILRNVNLNRVIRADVAPHLQISAAELWDRLAQEETHLTKLVRAERQRRIQELLTVNPHADLALIAKKCNLTHVNEASKLFKKCFGCTLRDYKRSRA
jgi:AraC-like DNA-binding protein